MKMQISRESKLVTRYLPFSLALITIFVNTNIGPDPVNLPKLTLLVIFGFYFLGIYINEIIHEVKSKKVLLFLSGSFIIGLVVSLFTGRSSTLVNFYGAWARNTGFLTYLMLLLIFLTFSALKQEQASRNLVLSLYIAGLFNVIYGLVFVLSENDPINWANRYGKFLSTLGNPDFGSGFLGMAYAAGIYFAFDVGRKIYFRICAALLLPIFIFIIINTGALQGLVLVALSTGMYGIIWLFDKFKSRSIRSLIISSSIVLFIISLLGTLQIGPLQNILYKTSVSIRGAYWRAAFEMFKSSPIYGIGLDSYGDWYRRSRDAAALILPGVDVTTDTAHNVFLDILAGGGLLLFIPYVSIFAWVTYRGFLNLKTYPRNLVARTLFILWICYVAQSAISINQIGLAVWGWALAGSIVGFTTKNSGFVEVKSKPNKNRSPEILRDSTVVVAFISTVLGLLIALPPQISEAKWQAAVRSKNINKILKASDAWPRSCGRYLMTYNVFAGTTYTQQALNVLEKCRKMNNDDFSSLILLEQFELSNEDKRKIKEEAHRLDPLNPKYI